MMPINYQTNNKEFLSLTSSQINRLEAQGCYSCEWERVMVKPDTDLSVIRNCRFSGDVLIGALSPTMNREGIYNANIENCSIDDHVYISNVAGIIKGISIGCYAQIENVGRIESEPEAMCALGVPVAVLDETGSRPVPLFEGLTSQLASLMARFPKIAEYNILPLLSDSWENTELGGCIGKHAVVCDTKILKNVRVGNHVKIEGASKLVNGRIVNNAPEGKELAYVGNDVDAENFIIVDGRVDTGVLLRNCFVGQGAVIDKRFSAHDTLFFANASCECGESCAVIAGPYTVSMHKSSLLIGAEYSFMNAGSATNFSNHLYKLGPVHWGSLQRGVKTSSGAYMMWDAQVGAFSLIMGQHKTHPDTSLFPFSYLFGTASGETVVSPGIMLKSSGLTRDMLKWPKRDRRIKARIPLYDNIVFEPLNPVTVSSMIHALQLLREIEKLPIEATGYRRYAGLLFSHNSLRRGRDFYEMAIVKYLHTVINEADQEVINSPCPEKLPEKWVDFGGQIVSADIVERIREACDASELSAIFNNEFSNYKSTEYHWAKSILPPEWKDKLKDGKSYIDQLDAAIEADRQQALDLLHKSQSR